jgi:hypothetical protein
VGCLDGFLEAGTPPFEFAFFPDFLPDLLFFEDPFPELLEDFLPLFESSWRRSVGEDAASGFSTEPKTPLASRVKDAKKKAAQRKLFMVVQLFLF